MASTIKFKKAINNVIMITIDIPVMYTTTLLLLL